MTEHTDAQASRDAEARIYLVFRTDLALGRGDLVRLAASACCEVLAHARTQAPERFARYDPEVQPKIGLRAKSEAALSKALAAAEASGIPAFETELAPGVPAALAVGPACRDELPPALRRLQLLDAPAPEPQRTASGLDPDTRRLWVLVREDIEMPSGKLAAQAAHAAWGAARSADDQSLASWKADGGAIAALSLRSLAEMERLARAAGTALCPAAFIVDAGRTVFEAPTPTALGVGPIAARTLPELLELPALA